MSCVLGCISFIADICREVRVRKRLVSTSHHKMIVIDSIQPLYWLSECSLYTDKLDTKQPKASNDKYKGTKQRHKAFTK